MKSDSRSSDQAPPDDPALPPWFLALTALVCGAFVMVIEVLGSRVIGPFFGVSLFVWTALITVTMVALAAGYWAGGLLSGRGRSADLLYGLIAGAGAGALAVPLIKQTVLVAAVGLGLRTGALASAMVLFGPSLFCLGCVSPLLVRIAAREIRTVGRTAGRLYALSTLGSVAGTVLTGFLLIAWLGVDRIFLLTGGSLLLLGCSWLFFRHRWAALPLLLFPLAWVAVEVNAGAQPLGDGVSSLERVETFYGTLRVVDRVSPEQHRRELLIDGQLQGALDMRSGLPLSPIMYFLAFLPPSVNPAGRDCLVVGLGAGLVPRWYAGLGGHTEVVEINPEVVRLARERFDFPPQIPVTVTDAREFLARPGRRYDFLILDVFNGDTTPDHLLSLEAFRLAKSRLAPGGVLALNAAGSLRHETAMTRSILRTLREVFATVEAYPLFSPEEEPGWGNIAVIAHDGRPAAGRRPLVPPESVHPDLYSLVETYISRPAAVPEAEGAIVLTDGYNPFDVRDLWLKEQVRRQVLKSVDPLLLL